MRNFYRGCLLGLLILTILSSAHSQCPQRPDELPASCSTGIPLVDGATINSGEEYFFSGQFTNPISINLNGGTLKVCSGTLTLQNINFNNGRIINLSVLNLTSDLAVQGSNFTLFNGPGALLNMANNDILINDEFINFGKAVFRNITINGSAAICLGNRSITAAVNVTNNGNNVVTVPSGAACFGYTGTADINGKLTLSPGLLVCKGSLANGSDSSDFGLVTIFPDCANCEAHVGGFVVVPIVLANFTASSFQGKTVLNWKTESEEKLKKFIVEQSTDNRTFFPIGDIAALNRPGNYEFTLAVPQSSLFRLKLINIDETFTYSRIVVVKSFSQPGKFELSGNPSFNGWVLLNIESNINSQGEVAVYDVTGKRVKKLIVQLARGTNSINLPLDNLPNGVFMITYHDGVQRLGPLRLLKMK